MHRDAHRREIALKAVAFCGDLPIIPLEEDIKAQLPPHRQNIVQHVGISGADKFDATDDLKTIFYRNDGNDAFDATRDLIGDDTCDQHIAVLARIAQQVEVSNMKEIESSGSVSNATHFSDHAR